MARILCPECLQSVEEAETSESGGQRLCPLCMGLARKRAEAPVPSPAGPGFLARHHAEILEWCRGRWWQVRLPLLAWFAWILVHSWQDPLYQPLFKGLNLGIHELGHYLFAPFGRFMGMLGGSLLQCLAPVLSMGMFLRQRDWFAIPVCFGWLATNLFDVATYVADARRMALPLGRPGGGHVIHDWNWLLGRMGLLACDTQIAFDLRCAATAAMGVCLLGGGWLVWRMIRSRGGSRPAAAR